LQVPVSQPSKLKVREQKMGGLIITTERYAFFAEVFDAIIQIRSLLNLRVEELVLWANGKTW
jgi:hypothetical protein